MATTDAVSGLAMMACRCATTAALAYIRQHQLHLDDCGPLNACIAAHVKAAMPAALHDAKEAIDCGMRDVAEHTFAASMALAGIEAAKEAGQPVLPIS